MYQIRFKIHTKMKIFVRDNPMTFHVLFEFNKISNYFLRLSFFSFPIRFYVPSIVLQWRHLSRISDKTQKNTIKKNPD